MSEAYDQICELCIFLLNNFTLPADKALAVYIQSPGLLGKVDFSVRHLSSTTAAFPSSFQFSSNQQCLGNNARQCAAYLANSSTEKTWTMHATFPEYVVALATIVGSVLFTVLPKLSSQTLHALLTSDELWVPSEEKRFELALYTLLAKGALGITENSEQASFGSEMGTDIQSDSTPLPACTRFVFSRVPLGTCNRNCQQAPTNDDSDARNGDLAGDGLTALVGLSQGGSDVASVLEEQTRRGYETDPQIRFTGSGTSVAGTSTSGIAMQMLDSSENPIGIEWENPNNSSISLDIKTLLFNYYAYHVLSLAYVFENVTFIEVVCV